jgi:hypothetical protein
MNNLWKKRRRGRKGNEKERQIEYCGKVSFG